MAQVLHPSGVGVLGMELIFPTSANQESQAHIDHRFLLGGHYKSDNDDVAGSMLAVRRGVTAADYIADFSAAQQQAAASTGNTADQPAQQQAQEAQQQNGLWFDLAIISCHGDWSLDWRNNFDCKKVVRL